MGLDGLDEEASDKKATTLSAKPTAGRLFFRGLLYILWKIVKQFIYKTY